MHASHARAAVFVATVVLFGIRVRPTALSCRAGR